MSTKRSLSALVVAAAMMLGVLVAPSTASALPSSTTKVGAWSRDWTWFDANVGPVDVYRGYDNGFHYATWQQVPRNLAHPGGINDYSFQIPPAQLARGLWDDQLRTFIRSTPPNIVLTNHHEPEQEIDAGLFTFAQFRAAQARLNKLVDEVNTQYGGNRKVSVILMISTFTGFKGRNPENYWPTAAKGDGGTVDLISGDVYAAPHGTGTAAAPVGYTDGINWKSPATLMKPLVRFAQSKATDWAVSELGYLEDVNNGQRKAQALREAVAFAKAGRPAPTAAVYRPALWISFWDSVGGRADWRLRWTSPAPTQATNTPAARAWADLRAQP